MPYSSFQCRIDPIGPTGPTVAVPYGALQPYMPYMTKYMKKGSGFVSQAAALLPVSRKAVDKHIETDKLAVVRSKLPKQVSITRETVEVEEKFVQIKCDQCPKTFKQNIQLKIHKKRNHFSF